MTATLDTYWAQVVTSGGEITHRGRSVESPLSVTLSVGNVEAREFTIPADTIVTLWQWISNVSEDFAALVLENLGTGLMQAQWKGDKPTSSTNGTPLGTHITWNTMAVCPHLPLFIGADTIIVNPSAADHAGDPGPIKHANAVDGKVYQIDVKNTDTTTAQRARLTLIN